MRSNPRIRGLAVLCLALGAALPVAGETPPEFWDRLAARLDSPPQAAAALGVADCPAGLLPRQPDRRVLQVIQDTLYSWEEHDLAAGGSCLVVRRPFEEALSAERARLLLTASAAWVRELDEALAALEVPVTAPGRLPAAPPLAGEADTGVVGRIDGRLPDGVAAAVVPEEERSARIRPLPAPALDRAPGGSVIGPRDDRAQVGNTGVFPFRVISYLNGTLTGGGRYRASGFLVGPHMVLTNGHVVWDERADRFVASMEIRPGSAAAAPRTAVRFATNASYVATRKIEFDYGAAFFDTPFPGISTFLPLVFDAVPALNSQVTIAGFPEVVRGAVTQAMWADTDVVTGVQGGILRYKVDTSGGNSGSPVGRAAPGGQVQVIAIHSNGDPVNDANSGVRLTARNFDLLADWLAWRPQSATGLNLTLNQVDAAGCPLVRAVVGVTNNAGRPVVDLNQLNFAVTENGVPQSISVEPGGVSNVPVSVALVLDGSGSLTDTDLANVKVAARAFVDLLGPRDKVAVYHFSDTVRLAQRYTSDKVQAKTAINALVNNGTTALYDAIIEAADDSRLVSGRRALVAMTDGMNNTGTRDERVPIAAARAAGVPVFTIGFGSIDRGVLNEIAGDTGGRFFEGATSGDLQAILRAIGRSLDNQYLLTWVTSFVSGGDEQVEVRVADGLQADQESFSYSQAGTAGCPPPPPTCQARIVAPNGGETWVKGRRQTLRWTTTGPSCGGAVGLGLSDGTEIWPVAETGDDGNQPVNVDFLPTGSRYRALVVDRATGANDASNATFTIADPAATVPCRPDAQTLCLRQNRFRVKVLWRTEQGAGGFARAVGITPESGYFWFVDNTSAELVVKIIDGRAINSHFWFFSGTLTNIDYAIFVTDTQTGEGRVYSNTVGDFTSFADLTAFGPPTEAAAAATPALAPALAETAEMPGFVERAGPCQPSNNRLCLINRRFQVEVTWQNLAGRTVAAPLAPLTANVGYSWFTTNRVPDLMVKMVDGRRINNAWWVFYGGLTDLAYTLKVTDTQTGRVRTYTNRRGSYLSTADTSAFRGN